MITFTSTNLPTPARALAVGAHPDDIEFQCGATLAKWAADGCLVSHLVLTDGSKGSWDPSMDTQELVRIRKLEQREAARSLGARGDVIFLHNVDGELQSGPSQRDEVAYWIRKLRPDVVLGHDPWKRYRLHPDHRHAGWLTVDAVVAARDPHFSPSADVVHHRPSELLLFEAQVPDHAEDVTGFGQAKVEALLAHRSQHVSTMFIPTDDDGSALEAFGARVMHDLAQTGTQSGFGLAESFARLATDR